MNARNETLDRALGHMAWANADIFARLAQLPDTSLALTAPGSEWSVAAIAHHIVTAAENYAQRLHGDPRAEKREMPTTSREIAALGTALAEADARLRHASGQPGEQIIEWVSFSGEPLAIPRWTLVNQAVHHATEHRAQIAGALAANGINAIDLDAVDVWTYEEHLRGAAGA
jgi:uncharacterized damage-inducible protein DinB